MIDEILKMTSLQEVIAWSKQRATSGMHKSLEYQKDLVYVIAGWSALYALSFIFSLIFLPTFRAMKRQKKADYVGRHISILHAILVSFLAFYGTFQYCEKEGSTTFTDRECFERPKQLHEAQVLITCGYFTFDFFVTLLLINDFTPLGFQTYLHHIIGMLSYYVALVSPYKQGLSLAVGITLVEVSSPFMHYRQFLFIHGLGDGILQIINSFFFFSTFLVSRILFLTYFSIKNSFFYIETLSKWQEESGVASIHKYGVVLMLASQVIAILLNFFWFQLIVKQLIRMLSKKKPSNETPSGDKKTQ
eukprot:403368553